MIHIPAPLPLRRQNRRLHRRHNYRRQRLWRTIVIIIIVVAVAVIISVLLSSSSPAWSHPQHYQHPHHHQSATAQRTLIQKCCLGSRCRRVYFFRYSAGRLDGSVVARRLLRKLPWVEDTPSAINFSRVAFADDGRDVHPVEINVSSRQQS